LVRLLDSRRAAAPGRELRNQANPAVVAALASGCAVLLCGSLILSPLFRVDTVVWTGSVALAPEYCEWVESASLGQSLLMLPERMLRSRVHDTGHLRIHLKKHLPNTLEVNVVSRLAVATADGVAVDGNGGALRALHADAGLPRLSGFALHGGTLGVGGIRALQALEQLRRFPTLRAAHIERDGDDVVLTLASTGTRVRMRTAALDVQLRKLRLYERSLGVEELPAVVDLRFRHQVVVRTAAGGAREDG
jgi:cell division septal protein FtsQ